MALRMIGRVARTWMLLSLATSGCDVRVSLGDNLVPADTDARSTVDGSLDAQQPTFDASDASSDPTHEVDATPPRDSVVMDVPASDVSDVRDATCSPCPSERRIDPPDTNLRHFGRSLASNDDWIAVGASTASGPLGSVQTVLVYRVNSRDPLTLALAQRLTPPTDDVTGLFGRSAAMADSLLFIGSGNRVYVYALGTFVLLTIVAPPTAMDFGRAISAHGTQLLVARAPSSLSGCETRLFVNTGDVGAPTYVQRSSNFLSTREPRLAYTSTGETLVSNLGHPDTQIVVNRFNANVPSEENVAVWELNTPSGYQTGGITSRFDFLVVGYYSDTGGLLHVHRIATGQTALGNPIVLSSNADARAERSFFGWQISLVGPFALVAASATTNAGGAEVGAVYAYRIPTVE